MEPRPAQDGDRLEPGRLRVGEPCVDPALDVVSRSGLDTKLEPRTMRLLMYLIDRRGEPAGVNELLDAVWPDVVFLSQSSDARPDESMRLARAAAQRALVLDPTNGLAHEALGEVRLSYDFDVPGAVAEFEAARHSDPSTPSGGWPRLYSGCLSEPCFDEFIGELSAQVDRDPLNASAYAKRGFVRYYGGDLAGSERDYRRTFELSPDLVSGHVMLACVLIARHRPEEAREAAGREPDNYWRRTALALAYHALGRRAEADRALAELVQRDAAGSAYQVVEVYAVRGESDLAFEWLERAVKQRDSGLTRVKVDPLLVNLRRDPRLAELVRRLNLQG